MSDLDGSSSLFHHSRHDADRWDALVLTALGEAVEPEAAQHIEACATCLADIVTLRHTVELARAEADEPVVPVDTKREVWDRIAAELDLPSPPRAEHTAVGVPTARRRRVALLAAAVVLAAGGAVGGYFYGRVPTPAAPVVASATLAPMPDGVGTASGEAAVHDTPAGSQLSVDTHGLPQRSGYYEVWLYDPLRDIMVAVGTLSPAGAGTFPVPPGLDVATYHVVDVSAQKYDGDSAHAQSVLRGSLAG